MNNYEALGVIETQYFTVAVELLDHMCKTANVEFLTSEKTLGGRLVTVIVGGTVDDVNLAVQLAKEICTKKEKNPLKMALVINKPQDEIMKFIVPSSDQKWNNQKSQKRNESEGENKIQKYRRKSKNNNNQPK